MAKRSSIISTLVRKAFKKMDVPSRIAVIFLIFSGFVFFSIVSGNSLNDTSSENQSGETLGEHDEEYSIISVTDGDTVKILYHGDETPVRLIGIDAPETESSPQPQECFGEEAKRELTTLLTGKSVRISFDETQDSVDRYDRLLLYIWRTNDNLFVNQYMIEEGYAHEYTYDTPYRYQSSFQQAEQRAQEDRRGLWGDICGSTLGAHFTPEVAAFSGLY